jgi:hypothetical protein
MAKLSMECEDTCREGNGLDFSLTGFPGEFGRAQELPRETTVRDGITRYLQGVFRPCNFRCCMIQSF